MSESPTPSLPGARPSIVVAAAWALCLALWLSAAWLGDRTPEVFLRADHLVFALVVALGSLLLVTFLSRIGRPGAPSLGLVRPGRSLGLGALWYTVPAGLGLAAAMVLGWIQVGVVDAGADAGLRLLYLVVLVFLSEALPEELMFRGLIQSRLVPMVGVWGAVIGQALLFTGMAALVGSAAGLMDLGFILFFGLALGMLRIATGSLWAPIGFHWIFMVVQQSHGAGWDLLSLTTSQAVQMLLLTNIPLGVAIALLFSRVSKGRP